jgi:hypothetical protein
MITIISEIQKKNKINDMLIYLFIYYKNIYIYIYTINGFIFE